MAIRNLLTTDEVAEILQVSPRTLASWRTHYPDDPRFVRIGGRAVRYRAEDIEAFIKSQDSNDFDEYDE